MKGESFADASCSSSRSVSPGKRSSGEGTDPAISSNTSVCLKVVDPAVCKLPADAQAKFVKGIAAADLDKASTELGLKAWALDAAPTVKICKPTGDQATVLAKTISDIGNGTINTGNVTGLDDYNGYVPTA